MANMVASSFLCCGYGVGHSDAVANRGDCAHVVLAIAHHHHVGNGDSHLVSDATYGSSFRHASLGARDEGDSGLHRRGRSNNRRILTLQLGLHQVGKLDWNNELDPDQIALQRIPSAHHQRHTHQRRMVNRNLIFGIDGVVIGGVVLDQPTVAIGNVAGRGDEIIAQRTRPHFTGAGMYQRAAVVKDVPAIRIETTCVVERWAKRRPSCRKSEMLTPSSGLGGGLPNRIGWFMRGTNQGSVYVDADKRKHPAEAICVRSHTLDATAGLRKGSHLVLPKKSYDKTPPFGQTRPGERMSESEHPDFAEEAAYIAHAYECLDKARESAQTITGNVESRAGGTHQARFERDVLADKVRIRLEDLDIGDQSLIVGRIDQEGGESFHIGRVAVFDENRDPMVVDWRAPIAEAFYRATGRQTMGLSRRRHYITRYRELLGLEDEHFNGAGSDRQGLKGERTLVAALESGRTGRLGDIVGTIQGEQDEIIRAPLTGTVIVQGGPGTGKTVVALHRAAYLLYTHRFPLAGQGVLVIGPNRLFLTYIEQVLPSLGESGVELTVLGDFVPDARVRGSDPPHIARIKGDLRMLKVLRRAVRQRQRPLRNDLVVNYGVQRLRFSVRDSEELIDRTRRRARFHNHGRKFVVEDLYEQLAASGRYDVDPQELKDNLHGSIEIREALEWMWPVLSAEELLNDFYGFRSLLNAAGEKHFGASIESLHRPRTKTADILWTAHDVPLLDELYRMVGPTSGQTRDHQLRTYGHIVIDEAQDLSPMQLNMVSRRSLGGSMTIVGDIAQATSAWAHESWESVTEHLPTPKGVTRYELTVGYRLPAPLMELAGKVLAKVMPDLKPPVAVRSDGDPPRFVETDADHFGEVLAATLAEEREAIGAGNIAIICTTGAADDVSQFLNEAGIDHGVAYAGALEKEVSIIEVSMVKGLELDAAIILEPDSIVEDEPQGMRSLYVALTRATRRLTIIDTGDSANVLK